jgi:membrane protease YdiL (CAAX protease family)
LEKLDKNKIYAGLFVLMSLMMISLMENGGPQNHQQDADLILRTVQAGARIHASAGIEELEEQEVMFPDALEPTELLRYTSYLEKKVRDPLLLNLALVAGAVGKADAAAELASKSGMNRSEVGDFRFLWAKNGELPASEERLRTDLELLPISPWVQDLAVARYLTIQGQAEKADSIAEEVKGTNLTYMATLGGTYLGLMTLGLGGLILLTLRRRLMAKYAARDPFYLSGTFRSSMPETLAIFLLWFSGSVVINSTLIKGISSSFSSGTTTIILYSISAALGLILIRVFGTKGFSGDKLPTEELQDFKQIFANMGLGWSDLNLRALLWGLGGYMIALPIVFLLSMLSQLLIGGDQQASNPVIPILINSLGTPDQWIICINVGLLAPLFEEILFRGFLLNRFQKYLGFFNGLLLSSMVFGAVHLSLQTFLPLMALGAILAAVARYSGSLWAAVLTHGLWNLTTVITLLVFYS